MRQGTDRGKNMSDEPKRGRPKTPAQHKKLASLLAQDIPVGEALRSAGWSARQSAKGWDAVPDKVMVKLPKKAKHLMALGKTDKESRKNLVRGRLVDNIVKGKDGGAMSAKILGSDNDLNMWQPEFQQGLIILQAPQWAILNKEKLLADPEGEVILPAKPPTQIEG
jgi:hypothetical protein